jgi:coenzyme PQQ precursor peptide PqqA
MLSYKQRGTALDFNWAIRRLLPAQKSVCINRLGPRRGWHEWKAVYAFGGNTMKTWTKPEVREQEVGLEVTSYLPAEIDII